MVRLNARKVRNRSSLQPAGSEPTTSNNVIQEAAVKLEQKGGNAAVDEKDDMRLLGAVKLGWSAGRSWAVLDGDVSLMHLTLCTARLSGFKRTVANVNCVMAAVEGLARAKGIIAPGESIMMEHAYPHGMISRVCMHDLICCCC